MSADEPWTSTDEMMLRFMFLEGEHLEAMAVISDRTPEAVEARIERLQMRSTNDA